MQGKDHVPYTITVRTEASAGHRWIGTSKGIVAPAGGYELPRFQREQDTRQS
jgi:hypothetical protein